MEYQTTIDRLKKLMEDNGVSRKKLSLDLNISLNTINTWLAVKGRTSMRQDTISKLAKYFKVEPLWLKTGISPNLEDMHKCTATPTAQFTKLCTFNSKLRRFEPLDTGTEICLQTYDFDGDPESHVAFTNDTDCKEYGITAGDILFIRKQPTNDYENGCYFISTPKGKTIQFVSSNLFDEKLKLLPSEKCFEFSQLSDFLFFKIEFAIKKL